MIESPWKKGFWTWNILIAICILFITSMVKFITFMVSQFITYIYGWKIITFMVSHLIHLWLIIITFLVGITFMVSITFMVVTFMGDTRGVPLIKEIWNTVKALTAPCNHSHKWPALVATSIVKPRLTCHLNSVMKSSRKRLLL